MAGMIVFSQHDWSASSWATRFVMEFLANQTGDDSAREKVTELVDNNILSLDLRGPESAPLVNLIADELPVYIAGLKDAELRELLTDPLFEELYRYARGQQNYNKDPTQDVYFTIGPNPAGYFRLNNLKISVDSHLNSADYVRIDVSDYTPEQRALLRDYVTELANPRVLIVGDD
jgi:hypothetical protein